MKKVLFTGCSYVEGTGFSLSKHEPNLWVNLLHQNTALCNFELINRGVASRSNQGIFQETVWQLTHNHYDYAFVSWTSVPRYELSLGLELYTTKITFTPNSPLRDCNTNEINYTKKYLEDIRDRLVTLPNMHFEILNLVYYINSLIELAKLTNTKIFFINALCPWDENYFSKLTDVLPDSYTTFTKELINVDHRCDEEIFKLYDKIHNEYNQAGGIQPNHWLNLYNSLRQQRIDVNEDNVHPGTKSNYQYFKILEQALEEKLSS